MNSVLDEYQEEELAEQPLQLVHFDEYIPSQSPERLAEVRLNREIIAASRHLKPRTISAITAVLNGMTLKDAGVKFRMHASTIANNMKREYGAMLVSALTRLYSLRDGTRYSQRELMLYRIACRNELTDPRTSIAALAEINRTKNDTPEAKARAKQNLDISQQPQVIIQLADPRLTASPLDELPPTMKDIN